MCRRARLRDPCSRRRWTRPRPTRAMSWTCSTGSRGRTSARSGARAGALGSDGGAGRPVDRRAQRPRGRSLLAPRREQLVIARETIPWRPRGFEGAVTWQGCRRDRRARRLHEGAHGSRSTISHSSSRGSSRARPSTATSRRASTGFGSARFSDFLPVLVYRSSAASGSARSGRPRGRIAKTVPECCSSCVLNAGRSQMAAALLKRRAEAGCTSVPPAARPSSRSNRR